MPERKVDYKKVTNKADVGLFVTAPSLQRLYIDIGLAFTDSLVQLDVVKDTEKKAVAAAGNTREALLLAWLTELLALFQNDKFLAKRIVFDKFDGKMIQATLWGEIYQSTRHGSVPRIKSIRQTPLEIGDKSSPEPHFFAQVFLES